MNLSFIHGSRAVGLCLLCSTMMLFACGDSTLTAQEETSAKTDSGYAQEDRDSDDSTTVDADFEQIDTANTEDAENLEDQLKPDVSYDDAEPEEELPPAVDEKDPLHWFEPKPPLARAPHDQWNFVPVEGAVCANGQQSGFFMNFSDKSDDLLIFLLGGGICYDNVSCLGFLGLVAGGLGNDPLGWWMSNGERTNGVFRRDNHENPFKDASYVVMPHCTVDFHSANKESNYLSTGKIQQRGYRNVQLMLNHVAPTFTNTHANVTLAGFSAGGVGSLANYHQVASAFEHYGHRPPFLINDSGPVQTRPFFSEHSHNAIRRGWSLNETIETWCHTCAEKGVHEALYWNHQHHPGLRSSQICAYGDAVVMGLYTLFDAANALRFFPHTEFPHITMKPGLDAYRHWSENFETQGMHRNLLYHRGERHGALTVAPLHDNFTPAIIPFLRAQMNRNDPHWFSPHF